MEKFAVGKRFPFEKYLTGQEITVAIPNEGFFDVLVSLHGLAKSEIKAFRTGEFQVSLFISKDIPFLIFDFKSGFTIDVSIDYEKIAVDATNWCDTPGNVVNLYLVDASTGILHVIRSVGVSFSQELKTACRKQAGRSGIEREIGLLLQRYSQETMIRDAVSTQVFLAK
ncbi:hypothetical protein [Prosthecochloris sp.]|uniref:hypothetical protein n=1 Tax=Prosthecochloris sp. TaxID=290513 RepID=UPI0025CF0FED|nr:hypothetical protein [Prosthecochloris sp.]